MDLSGKVAIVSGGSSGLGAGTVRMFVNEGARVVIVDRDVERGQLLVTEMGSENVRFCECDVTNESQVQKAVELAWSAFSSLDVSVACAGIAPGEKTVGKEGQAHSLATFEKVIAVNLVGTFNLSRLAAASMVKNKADLKGAEERGVLIHTASVAAYEGQLGQVAYAATKGAVVSMTLPMARDLSRSAIRVMTIAPGIFQTPMMDGMPEKVKDSLAAQIPFPSRFGRPEEYALLVKSICLNPVLNGETIRLDGAIRMQPR